MLKGCSFGAGNGEPETCHGFPAFIKEHRSPFAEPLLVAVSRHGRSSRELLKTCPNRFLRAWSSLLLSSRNQKRPEACAIFFATTSPRSLSSNSLVWLRSWGNYRPMNWCDGSNPTDQTFRPVRHILALAVSCVEFLSPITRTQKNSFPPLGRIAAIGQMAMGHNLCLHFGAEEYPPCTTYFDVHHTGF